MGEGMRIRIHRGAAEVGGNCVEVEASTGERILLDLGRPLSAAPGDHVPLPQVSGLEPAAPDLLAVVITHPHLDHYGLLAQVDPRTPVFMGEAAARVVAAARFFSPSTPEIHISQHLVHRVPMQIGPFTIEPRLNDHSAFDAYSLQVDADGRRLFYTGDIRGHGRKGRLFDELLDDPPRYIDVLLMEGTHVTAAPASDSTPVVRSCASEAEVEDRLVDLCRDTEGLVVVCGSAQNADRLVSVHRAALRGGRSTVLDLYAATIAAAAAPSIPQPGHKNLRVYVPNRQRVRVKQAAEFGRVKDVAAVRVYAEELAANPGRFLVHMPSSTVNELLRSGALDATGAVVWSLWDGYLRDPSGKRLTETLTAAGVPLISIHTSGHAGVPDLQRLVAVLKPDRVVPIHSEAPQEYARMFPRVENHADGEWWDV